MKKEVFFLLSKEKQIKNFTKKKSIHTCNQYTRMNTPHSVRLAQKLKAKKRKRKKRDISRQKSTHTHVCATQLRRVHTYHSKRRKKKSLQNGADWFLIHSFIFISSLSWKDAEVKAMMVDRWEAWLINPINTPQTFKLESLTFAKPPMIFFIIPNL